MPSNTSIRRKKIKKIKEKDRALTLFNFANLALMINTGTTGFIKAVGALHDKDLEPLTTMQIGTETSTLIVTTLFVVLAILANRFGRTKKHDELTVKAHELDQTNKMDPAQARSIKQASKRIKQIDTFLTLLTGALTFIFVAASAFNIFQKASGPTPAIAITDIISNIFYIFAVSFTLINKVLGDKLQANLEKKYFNSTPSNSSITHNSLINRLAGYLSRLLFKSNKNTVVPSS